MSDTENKTEKNAEKAEVAPYMKRASTDNKTESKKSNFVIPMVLLLVSAIVIVATFYEDEYNALMTAQSDETTETAQPETQAGNPAAETVAKTNTVTTADTAAEAATAKTATTEAPVAAEVTAAPKAETASTAKSDKQPQVVAQTVNTQVAPAATAQAKTAQLQPNAQFRSNNANRYNGYNREQASARTKQHMAIIQQRRQTYEQEMQTRRTQYETAMKTQQERRSNMIEAQKAAYQRAQKSKVETGQKLQVIYKKIDGLHQEIDQIMREYYSTRKSSTAPMHTL